MQRPLLCVLTLTLVLFAGCTADPSPEVPPPTDDPILHTNPDDLDISPEDARTRGHLHDYWNGQQKMVVIDDTVSMMCQFCGRGASAFRYEAPAGGIIPQGTRWVNITLSWTTSTDSQYASPRLWVETAADHEPWDAGEISSGDTILLEVDNDQNDLPHEVLSNWAFELRVAPPIGGMFYRMNGQATLVVEVARGHPIPVYPPHPDLWNGTTEILLFDERDAAEPVYHGSPNANAGSTWLGPHVPADGVVVPYDMDHITVTLTYEDDAPISFTLAFHGAGSRDWTLLQPVRSEGKTHTYTVTPDEGRPDGPYAKQSQWVFEVFTTEDPPYVFVGGYRITATVYLQPQ